MTALAPPGLTPVTPPTPAAETAGVASYRLQTLGMDALALTALLVGADYQHRDFVWISAGTYLAGAPLVHVVKGRNGHALASVTMRIGFPLLGALVGDKLHVRPKCDFATEYECYDDGPNDEVILGVVAGLLGASIIDTAYLAKGDPPRAERAPMWTPTARATTGGVALGVAGRF